MQSTSENDKDDASNQCPQYKACLSYLREGNTLIITKLDRLARSATELSKLTERFNVEKISLIVLYQYFDTSTPTGRLMFNMLVCIAEFENGLRSNRQAEGIIKAHQKGVKFDKPKKLPKIWS